MYYTETHDWICPHSDDTTIAKVGISQFAEKEIGEVVYIELPKIGTEVEKGQEIAVIESTKAAIDIYSVLKGTVLAINEALVHEPGLINEAPEGEGWLYMIRLEELIAPHERFGLLLPKKYQEIIS